MKTITKMLAALLLLQWAYSCVSDSPVDNTTPAETDTPKHPITVKAHLPSSAESRAQIAYGCQDTTREIFMWNNKDWFTLFNITRLSECPNGIQLETTDEQIHGNIAEFESLAGFPEFTVKAGDIIFANCFVTERKQNADLTYDERDIFNIYVGAEENRPQYIVKNPDNSSLAYMKDNLKMYDIVIAEKDGEIPELHFKHLSALMRITLRNATGKDIYPTKLEFKYPSVTGIESFFNTTLYCSVTGDNPDNFGLKVYDDKIEFYGGSEPYTANIGTTINGKKGTADAGESIPAGESYELYLSTVPRINNDSYGDSLTIHLIANHKTQHPFSITLKGFNEVITAGKRYWFDLTATPDSTLMLTSQWKKLHPDSTGGETTPEN